MFSFGFLPLALGFGLGTIAYRAITPLIRTHILIRTRTRILTHTLILMPLMAEEDGISNWANIDNNAKGKEVKASFPLAYSLMTGN